MRPQRGHVVRFSLFLLFPFLLLGWLEATVYVASSPSKRRKGKRKKGTKIKNRENPGLNWPSIRPLMKPWAMHLSKSCAPPVPVRPPSYSHGFRWCKGVSLLRGAGYALRAALACQPMLRLRGLQSLSEVDQGNVRPEVPKLVAHSSQCALIILECFRQDFQSLLGVCVSQPVNTPTPSQRSFGSTGE